MVMLSIAELSRRSGFSASTLRWYESIGVLPEPARSPAGYRQYGNDAVERLALVTAGKQLGLRLHEIAELADLRTDRSCGEVQERLAQRIADRLAVVEEGQTVLVDQAVRLRSALEQLDAANASAPEQCGASCVCDDALHLPARPGGTVPIESADPCGCHGDGTPPTACTLDATAIEERVRDWQDVVRLASPVERAPGRRRLTFPADPELVERLAILSAAETSCCGFLSLNLQFRPAIVVLEAAAPADAEEVLDALFGRTSEQAVDHSTYPAEPLR